MNNNYKGGRVNTSENTYFYNNNCSINTEDATNMISRTYGIDNLTSLYFSENNINLIQEEIIKYLYNKSNGKYNIGKQSDTELKIIMKSMYLSKRDKLTDNNVVNQVKSLNKMVILECSRIIEINLLQHLNYVKDLNKLPNFQELPQNVSNKGTKYLELYK
tara:strand:- start:209 stop:691 length:483 start_codon:yes stop_codon:yes gene_type:complete